MIMIKKNWFWWHLQWYTWKANWNPSNPHLPLIHLLTHIYNDRDDDVFDENHDYIHEKIYKVCFKSTPNLRDIIYYKTKQIKPLFL